MHQQICQLIVPQGARGQPLEVEFALELGMELLVRATRDALTKLDANLERLLA